MSKAKGKSGTGRGTGKKGWTRWQKGANKAMTKPYKSKGVKNKAQEDTSNTSNQNDDTNEK